jgi:phospholipase C
MNIRTVAFLVGVCLASTAIAETPAACPFAAGALPVDTLAPGAPHGNAIPINHVLVLMQENRSFDHYFARMHGRDIDRPPRRASNPNPLGGAPVEIFHQHNYCEVADLDHSWNGSHAEWNGGAMDGFAIENADPADPSGSRAMGYYRKRDLRFYHVLYRTFAMSDRHFCSLLGPTFPNRHYLLSGTSAGHIRNDVVLATHPSIFESLDAAGVTWKVYASDLPFAILYAYVQAHAVNILPIAQFYADAAAGTLPQVALIDPIFFGDETNQNDEHPPNNVQVGQAFVAGVVQAVFQSPNWSDSALFITYDEHGGFYDHVPPPPACEPDAIPPNLQAGDVVAAFDRYGFRVPLVVVSPFARRKYVSHTVTDQTSVLRFIETRFDLPALTRRDANADPMLEFFDFASPPFVTPPKLPEAKINPDRRGCTG